MITRPSGSGDEGRPRWLHFLRSLLSGIYTIDNMDFVLRDAYMTGYSVRAFDLDRLLHYSFFSDSGLTIHDRGLDALVRFMGVRAELFRSVYFHRTVRAIDLTLADLFAVSKQPSVPRQSGREPGRLSAIHRVLAARRCVPLGLERVARDAGLGAAVDRPAGAQNPLENGLPAESGLRRNGPRAEQHLC